jgi:hypothetical protein
VDVVDGALAQEALVTWVLSRWRAIVAAGVATVIVVSVAAFAILHDGYSVRRVDLNDSGIWVTNDSGGFYGRLNKSASAVDAFFQPAGGAQGSYALDVFQDQGKVLAWDKGGARLVPVNVASAKLLVDAAVSTSTGALVDMRGGTVAVLDSTTGEVRAARYDVTTAAAPDLRDLASTAKPVAKVAPVSKPPADGAALSALAVGWDGAVHAADASGRVVTLPVVGGVFDKPATREVGKLGSVELTAVGSRAVVLDAADGRLLLDNGASMKVADSRGMRLQQPGPDTPEVLVASGKALYAAALTAGGSAPAIRSAFDQAAGSPAAPVQVGGCAYGAWAGSPGQVVRGCGPASASPVSVDRAGSALARPVFRINRSQVVVNDAADGRVFDVDLARSVDNWQQLQEASKSDAVQEAPVPVNAEEDKPKANKDNLGARPGRTTLLHVLDNDTDKAGRILSISSVTQPGNAHAKVSLAPDGQTLIYALDEIGGDADFSYQLSNGTAEVKGDVHVSAKAPGENSAPRPKAGAANPTLAVPSGATLPISVLADWRDDEGDPVALADASASAGTAAMTADGRIEFTAAASESTVAVKVGYVATDGTMAAPKRELTVGVLGSKETKGTAAVTQPDVGRGEVGRAIVVSPLVNDTPGADPLNPKAVMRLAAPVAPKNGVTVTTDLVSGQLVVTPAEPGHFFLSYTVGFGSAATAEGQIRIDAEPAKPQATAPVAVPDTAAVRGTGSVLVDVLANDSDPIGSVLTVQSADPKDAGQVQAAVLGGRWLRITPSTAEFASQPQTIRYTVTNGLSQPAEGVVSVTQLPALETETVITRPDYVAVRDGDSTLIRVLDNDATLSGAPLSLLGAAPEAKAAGQLRVYNPAATDQTGGDLGAAYVARDAIRYVAPAQVPAQMKLIVEYVAQTQSGDRATGTVEVTVNPQPGQTNTDREPTPQPIDARVTAGETYTIPVAASGHDPDGDSTAVVGLTSAPGLGRVLGYSPTGITYQAYPDAQGTDTFGYTVADRYGKTAISLVRVAVVPPSRPQPPVAAPVSITAAPGSKITVYPLTAAFHQRTDPVRVSPLGPLNPAMPPGVTLVEKTNSIEAVAGQAADRPIQISYSLTGNGGEGAPTTLTIYAQQGFRNPPQILDQVAKPDGTPTARVEVLATAYDPDGDAGALTVTRVGAPDAKIEGTVVVVPVRDHVQAIPYEVTDASGATSAAVIYVPAQGAGGPFVRIGKVISVPEGQSATVAVADYVDDPRGRVVTLTTTDRLWASPASVSVTAPSADRLTVTAAAGYVGPGAVIVEVTDGKTLDDPEGIRSIVSIPVQVGPDTPMLRCPADAVGVVRGGKTVTLDVMSACSVWTPTKAVADAIAFDAVWTAPIPEVTVAAKGRTLTLDAAGAAKPGSNGVVTISVPGSKAKPSTLSVTVLEAPKPTLSLVTLPEMKQGDLRTIDMRGYFRSPLKDPQPQVIGVRQVSGQPAMPSSSGTTVSITPGATSWGRMEFQVVMSDVADTTDTARQVTGRIVFDVFGRPGKPSVPQPGQALMSRSAVLSWAAPPSNGAPIDGYEVAWLGGTQRCAASPCTITGLTNGSDYSFTVRAHNKADWSDSSDPSAPYRPNAMPLAVAARQTAADDKAVTLEWGDAQGEGSAITNYLITVNGQPFDAGTARKYVVPVAKNGIEYTFTIVAKNNSVLGPSSTAKGFAASTPIFPGPVTPQPVTPINADTTALNVTWVAAAPNGPERPSYTLTRSGGGAAKTVCTATTATTCQDTSVTFGDTYTYSVTATTVFLGVTRTPPPVSSAAYTPVGKPAPWSPIQVQPTGADGTIRATFNVPPSRGTQSTVTWLVNGAPNGVVGSYSPDGASGQAQSKAGLSNGATYAVALRVCNEKNQCSDSNAVNVSPYGPIPAPTVSMAKVGATTFRVNVSANGNGRQITVRISTDLGHNWSFATTGSQAWNSGDYGVSYSQSDRAHVTITDSAGRSVPGQVDSNAVTADPPPQPAVFLSFDLQSTTSTCASCRKVNVRTENFAGRVSCHLEDSYGTPSTSTGSPPPTGSYKYWSQGPNETVWSGNWWGTHTTQWIKAVCGGVSSNVHTGSPS